MAKTIKRGRPKKAEATYAQAKDYELSPPCRFGGASAHAGDANRMTFSGEVQVAIEEHLKKSGAS